MAVEAVKNFRLGPLFTPPSVIVPGGNQGTVGRPSTSGGANWSGAAVDPGDRHALRPVPEHGTRSSGSRKPAPS